MNRGRLAGSLVWSLFAACALLYALTIAIELRRGDPFWPLVAGFLATPAVGAIVASRQPQNVTGRLLLVTGLGLGVAGFGSEYAALSVIEDLPLGAEAGWLANLAFFSILVSGAVLLPLHFPDGRLPSQRWRPVLLLTGAAMFFGTAGYALKPGDLDLDGASLENPFGIPGTGGMLDIGFVLLISAALAAGFSLVARFRRSRGEERQQLKWFAFAATLMVVALCIAFLGEEHFGSLFALEVAAYVLLFLALPVSIGIAVLRYRLWDIDVVIRRSLVYGTIWLTIAGAYFVSALLLGLAAVERVPVWLAIALTVLATLLFQPARRWLEQAADRWVFGRRQQPLKAVHSFGELLGSAEHAGDIASYLASIAVVAAPLAWIQVDVIGSAGIELGQRRDGPHLSFPLMLGKERLGEMQCQALPGSSLKEDESAMLGALAGQAGIAISHTQLASRIVRAQETERRRIERNIHDGAQQELVALVAKLGLARMQNGQLDHGLLLAELQDEVRAILSHLRELAQGVYPSVLADGGLVAAVEDRCSRLPIEVDLQVSPELRNQRLDEDVEGAAYFVFAEGLTNLLRHSGASSATVRLSQDAGQLCVEIADNGAGFDPQLVTRAGGLKGLADRVQTIRGSLSVQSVPGEGTKVHAELPLRVRSSV